MWVRLFNFVAAQLAGAALAWVVIPHDVVDPLASIIIGMLIAAWLWFVLDTLRANRLLTRLQINDSDDSEPPDLGRNLGSGLWSQLADRMRRRLRRSRRFALEQQQRLQDFLLALQASPNGVVLLDRHGRIEWFNQTAAAHFGLEVGRDQAQALVNLVRDPIFTSYLSTRDFRSDVVIPGRTHSVAHPLRLSVHLHHYGDDRLLLLSRDVTALEQADAMRRDFVANASHEIRTPLTVLGGFVQTMQDLQLDEEQRQRYLDLMATQARNLQTLVSDLLTLSRLEGSPPASAVLWTSVPALLASLEGEVRVLSRLQHPTGSQVLDFAAAPQCEIAGADAELRSAMLNLLSNAVRYTPAHGEIDVAWTVLADGRLEFAVNDNGPGIAQEHLPRLTERFYRIDRSRSRDSGGTGLGLAIVKHVAQRHGAELHIESKLGLGSRFSITFPASRVRWPENSTDRPRDGQTANT